MSHPLGDQPADDQLVAEYLHRLRAAASGLPADRASELAGEIEAHIAEARAAAPAGPAAVRGILDRLGEPADIVAAAAEAASDLPGLGPAGGPDLADGSGRGEAGDAQARPGAAEDLGAVSRAAPVPVGPPWPPEPGRARPSAEGWQPPDGWQPVERWQPGDGWNQGRASGSGWDQGRAGGSGWDQGRAGGSGWNWAGAPAGAGPLEICAVVFLLIGGIVVPLLGWLVGVILLWQSPRWALKDKLLGTLIWPGGLLAPLGLLLFGGVAVTAATSGGGCTATAVPQPVRSPGPSSGSVTHHAVQCATAASPGGLPGWLIVAIAVVLLAVAVAGPIYTAIRLLNRARRGSAPAARPQPAPAMQAY